MLGWLWDVRPDEPDAELDAAEVAGPPGVERPAAAALFSGPGTLRLPSRSAAAAAAAEWAGPCSRGGGGGRPGEGVNRAPELALDGGRRGPEDPEPLM